MAFAGLCVPVSVCQCLVCVCASLWCVPLCVLGDVGSLQVWGVCVIPLGVCLWVVVSLGVLYIYGLDKGCGLAC